MSLRPGSIKHNSSDDEKGVRQHGNGVVDAGYGDVEDPLEDGEVFKKTHNGINFRTVGWPRASVIFLKGTSYVPNCQSFKLFHHPSFTIQYPSFRC
jgi:hypothetical protein